MGKNDMWVCIFPGKLELVWKIFRHPSDRKYCESVASEYNNVVAIPEKLWKHIEKMQERAISAERKLNEIRCII